MFAVKETSGNVIVSEVFPTEAEAQNAADGFNYWAANAAWTGELNYVVCEA